MGTLLWLALNAVGNIVIRGPRIMENVFVVMKYPERDLFIHSVPTNLERVFV